jgi:radical SAM superfamily enzyme YgiQ (UPF0313 family)
MSGNHQMFRPPSEAGSLIIRVADSCPHNTCTFCGMYKGVPYRQYSRDEMTAAMDQAAEHWPSADRIFLADGDVMALPIDDLVFLLTELTRRFSNLNRVNLYANGSSIISKSEDQLAELKRLKLQTLYMGLESGDQIVLDRVCKRDSVADMITGGRRAQAAGLRMSVMVLIGLGGAEHSLNHAAETAKAINAMQPRFLAALRLIPVQGTPLYKQIADGSFQVLTEFQATVEIKEMIGRLELDRTLFRANHVSNIVPLGGRFPKDRERMVEELDTLLASGVLDEQTAGPEPWTL